MGSDRILIIAIRAIGDVVLITPIIRQLRNAYPEAYLAVLADGPSAQILQNNPHLDRVFVIDRRFAKQSPYLFRLRMWVQLITEIRRERFDTVVDLFSGPTSAIVAWLSRATDRYGEDFRNRIRGFLYSHALQIRRNGRHLIEQKLDLIHPLVGMVELSKVQLELFISAKETQQALALLSAYHSSSQRIVGFVPSAGSQWRIWPPERFAELADAMVEKYKVKIVLVGGEHDRFLCQRISEMMKDRSLDLSGQTSLRELIAVLAELDLVISNVTGPMHIASALAKPKVIGLYGAADTIQYAPRGNHATMITKGKSEEAYWQDVDYQTDHKRLLEISVSDVLAAIPRVMKEWDY